GKNFGDLIPVSPVGEVSTVTISTASLAMGAHPVIAVYSGDGPFLGSAGHLAGGQIVNAAPVPRPRGLVRTLANVSPFSGSPRLRALRSPRSGQWQVRQSRMLARKTPGSVAVP